MRLPQNPDYSGYERRPPRIVNSDRESSPHKRSSIASVASSIGLTCIVGLFAAEAIALVDTTAKSVTTTRAMGLEPSTSYTPESVFQRATPPLAIAAMNPLRPDPPTLSEPIPTPEPITFLPVLPAPPASRPIETPEPAIDYQKLRRDRLRHRIHFKSTTPENCLPPQLLGVIYDIAETYGDVRIHSTHRSHRHNARVGGARQSFHLECRAIDFTVPRGPRNLFKLLRDRPEIGGLKRYPAGFFHIDNGPKRTW